MFASFFSYNKITLNKTLIYSETSAFLSVSASLQIVEAEEEDQGSYECVADNSKGTAVSGPATLYVRGTFSDTNLRGVQNTNDLKTLTKKCFKTI